jgi:hypothetical protein
MPLALNNLTQNAVEHEVAQQYRAAGGAAAPRVVNIQNWTPPDPNGDFIRAFGVSRRGVRTDEVIAVHTERRAGGAPGFIDVYLIPNLANDTVANLGSIRLKVGEAQL